MVLRLFEDIHQKLVRQMENVKFSNQRPSMRIKCLAQASLYAVQFRKDKTELERCCPNVIVPQPLYVLSDRLLYVLHVDQLAANVLHMSVL